MRKLSVAILLAVILAIPFGIGTAFAKTPKHGIEFNLSGDVFVYETEAGETTIATVPAEAVFGGIIRDKKGATFLSPMKGNITIDGVEHNIKVKAVKESEPVFRYIYPGEMGYADWAVVEVNIGGDKAIGTIYMWSTSSMEETRFQFTGIFDGKWHAGLLKGDLPTND